MLAETFRHIPDFNRSPVQRWSDFKFGPILALRIIIGGVSMKNKTSSLNQDTVTAK